uniref:Uncharacterized protein n=1 Tax=viral metagenome TaxID=1070528 RepID=A0A6C0API6_9ZZZZ
MDTQRFIKPTYPDFRPKANSDILQNAERRVMVPDKRTIPVEDMRYPGYDSIMADARLVTDYKSQCEYNVVPSQYGNSFRSWLQHHADGFIQVSRHRQAQHAGSYYYGATHPLPPKQFQRCDEFDCTFSTTDLKDGIGLQRREEVPALFGTFAAQNTEAPMKRIFLTDKFEGGRNTPHGRKYRGLGNSPSNPRAAGYGSSG